MYSKILYLTLFLTAFASLVLVGTMLSHNPVLASQDIDQTPAPNPNHPWQDVYDNQGQCIKDHKIYDDKSVIDTHCKDKN